MKTYVYSDLLGETSVGLKYGRFLSVITLGHLQAQNGSGKADLFENSPPKKLFL